MAGYFLMDSEASMEKCIWGTYSTRIKPPRNMNNVLLSGWLPYVNATIRDHSTMKAGDYVFLFNKRNIYGIGKIVNVKNDCVNQNYPNQIKTNNPPYSEIKNTMLCS